jgi:hypothetical protein
MSELNLTPFWIEVTRTLAEDLPQSLGDTIYIVSLPLKRDRHWRANVTIEASRWNAAQRLAEGLFRLATPEEIQACKDAKTARERDMAIITDRALQARAGGGGILHIAQNELRALGEV